MYYGGEERKENEKKLKLDNGYGEKNPFLLISHAA